uniref:Alpha-L-rhamnosidase n=2 Tax=Macrostomum lignano TaxID=282301 RepID=A0A1I8G1H5_9PLAT
MTIRLPATGNSSKNEAIVDFHRQQNTSTIDYINAKPAPNKKLELEWAVTSRFKPEISSPGVRHHFIPTDGYQIGLVREYFVFTLSGHATYPANSIGPFDDHRVSETNPKLAELTFSGQLTQLPPTGWELQSGQTLRYSYTVKNGGFVTVDNLDANGVRSRRFLTGQEFSQVGTFVFDFNEPYHCTRVGQTEGHRSCRHDFDQEMLQLSVSFTRQNEVTARFGGWRDDHAGIVSYEAQVMPMYRLGDRLNENHHGAAPPHKSILLTGEAEETRRDGGDRQFSIRFELPPATPAVYSIIVTARDAVRNAMKNLRRTRRFFIYDNTSFVSKRDSIYPLSVDNSISNDGHWWLQNLDENVVFRWTDSFINEIHDTGGFLLPIIRLPELYNEGYEHNAGPRSVNAIDNVHGVVHFAAQFGVDADGGRSLQNPDASRWLPTADLHAQMQSFRVSRRDGESAKLWVRAEDVMNSSQVNSFVLHFDSSPAQLGQIGLVNRGVDGLVVHHSRSLHELRAQWTSSDVHSGLYTVKWEIIDNYTDSAVLMHSQHERRQRFDSAESCRKTSYRPEYCYCTAITGCFNAFYAASPNTEATTEHNHDLLLKLTVTNSALLTSSSTIKISIDLSAPHPGHVFDGAPGSEEEVDFQSGRLLRAHWSGFFDPESGIRMYRYGFGASCLSESQLHLETTGLEAIWEAPGPGSYMIAVAAYNNAMEPSAVVYSDGVLITDHRPSIAQISIGSLRVRPGLLLDAGSQDLWYLTETGRRRELHNDNATCRARATRMENTNLLALDLSKFNESVVQKFEDADCEDIGPAGEVFYLVTDSAVSGESEPTIQSIVVN